MTGQSWGLSQSGQDRFSESCPSFSFLPTWLTTTFFFYPDHKTFSLIMQKDQMSNYFPFLSIHFILLHCRPNLHSYGQLSIIHSLYTQPFSWWREFTLSANLYESSLCTYITLHGEAQTLNCSGKKKNTFWLEGDLIIQDGPVPFWLLFYY